MYANTEAQSHTHANGAATKAQPTIGTTRFGLYFPFTAPTESIDRELVRQATLAYFCGDELAVDVWMTKYALRNELDEFVELSPADTQRRLAREFARIEARYPNPLSETEILHLFDFWKYVLPQGGPQSAVGNPYMVQSCSNCFVINGASDSYGGILRADEEQAQIMKRRGGVGHDVSNIRPKHMHVSNAARTTAGLGVYLQRFSNTTREVGQEGRRGALMLTCDCRHPEILTFIDIKRNKTLVTGANMSIRWSDDFMRAVEADAEYTLRWPCEAKLEDAKATKVVRAREIWEAFIDAAHTCAEPGALFWDTILRESIADCYADLGYRTVSTNPCQPTWATVLTPQGIRPLGVIKAGDTIWSGKRWTKVKAKWSTGVKDVYAYRTRAGTFYGTENHRVLQRGEKVEVKDAETIDTAQGGPLDVQSADMNPQHIMDGLLLGDGMYHRASRKDFLLIGKEDMDYFTSEVKDLIGEASGCKPGITWNVEGHAVWNLPKTYDRKVPTCYKRGALPQVMCAFLRGLYSANGSIVDNRVTLKAASKSVIEDAQEMLSALGIRSYYTTNPKREVEFENGLYECRESYDLNITTDRTVFRRLIGFIQKDKQARLDLACETKPATKPSKSSYEIVEVEKLGAEEVFDMTVEDEEHTYWTGGLLVSNCGEITLSAYDACRLVVMNLMGFVERPYTKEAFFDFGRFSSYVQKAQRLMDDLVDLEIEAIDRIIMKVLSDPEPETEKRTELELWQKIREANVKGRRTGLGVTALGDCLAALGIKYGSDDSIKMTEDVYRELACNSERSNVQLAKERGAFPIWDAKREAGNPYLDRVRSALNSEVWEADYQEYGRRGISTSTTAPGGSISPEALVLDAAVHQARIFNSTTGIEPVSVSLTVKRRRKLMEGADRDVVPDFIDPSGDRWQEYTIHHPGLKAWMQVTGETDVEKSPYWGATSRYIDWESSVEMQARAQKWVSHSISKTCNLPENVSKEVVSRCYMKAWKSGCKGFTVYREGSRTGVIIDANEGKKAPAKLGREAEGIVENHAPKRPSALPCDIHHVTIKGQKWVILIGCLGDRPYEIFGGLADRVELPKKLKTGALSKQAKKKDGVSVYDLMFDLGDDDEMHIRDVITQFDNPTEGAFTRAISLSLRHGVPVQYIVEQLLRDKHSDMTSFSVVLARVLKKYVKDGTHSASEKACSTCGASPLTYQEGCITCKACGWSKCG